MIILKNKSILNATCVLIITSLLIAGCSNGTKISTNGQAGTNNTASTTGASTINKDAKTISDSDLMNSATSDSTAVLDSVDDPGQQLSSDEIDALLNDNSAINDIPTNFTAK